MMRSFLLPVCSALLLSSTIVSAQTNASAPKLTKARLKVEEATKFQMQLGKGKVSFMDVLSRWQSVTNDPEVRADKDALAIAYACEGLVEKERGEFTRADSLLERAMPLFQSKTSKAYFLVNLATFERDQKQHEDAMKHFAEVLLEYDVMPQLKEIPFYAKSGYAELAYGIDAARNIGLIGPSTPELRKQAIALLEKAYNAHRDDQLGFMAITALEHVDIDNRAKRRAEREALMAKKQNLKDLDATFAGQFR